MPNNEEYVLKQIEERGIYFIRLWFTDVLGNLKSFAVTPSEIESAFEEGMGFDGSSIEGFCRTQESDIVAFPDASTFQILPWRPEDNGVARMFCEVRNPDGTPFAGDPRYALRRMVEKAASMGYTMNVGPDLEFYYFEDHTDTKVLDTAGYFDLTARDNASDLRRDTVLTLEKMSIPVEYSHHEAGPSQQEIDLRFDDALSMADAIMTYRLVVKEVAIQHGVYATFMPKPFADQNGNAMHIHQSLFTKEGNAFYDKNDPEGYGLSQTAKHYIAGLLKYAPEYAVITNQYVNSYRRLVPGHDAPIHISWTNHNRSSTLRIPLHKPGKELSTRVEMRSADSACNPYLALAVMLGAGLEGIEQKLDLAPPVERDTSALSSSELKATGIELLPSDLGQAIDNFEQSALMKEILGEHIHRYIVENKRAEWNLYRSHVTQWELDRYLSVL